MYLEVCPTDLTYQLLRNSDLAGGGRTSEHNGKENGMSRRRGSRLDRASVPRLSYTSTVQLQPQHDIRVGAVRGCTCSHQAVRCRAASRFVSGRDRTSSRIAYIVGRRCTGWMSVLRTSSAASERDGYGELYAVPR